MTPRRGRGTYDVRDLMARAVAAMHESRSEVRKDGKVPPKVGAVLRKPDGSVEAAFRSELRDGDHAEYTLLERKNWSTRLDGCVLFTTLEPCAPGSRQSPKLSCAERIALTRIKEVWVGLEDPDPTVDRKGIKFLQECGVLVRMFERDFQDEIRKANERFIEQALVRAAEARAPKRPKEVVLSPLEMALDNARYGDFSRASLEEYRRTAKVEPEVGTPEFDRLLLLQGAAAGEPGRVVPTGFGIILFGEKPRDFVVQAGLLATIHRADRPAEAWDFDGPQIFTPDQVIRWLGERLPDTMDRSAARRRSTNKAVFELVREGVANALVHRDYAIQGAKCQLKASEDTISVWSPGRPIEPITVERLASFTAPMLSRNPVLHYAFSRMELAEERGLGLNSMRNRAEAEGLPLPRFEWKEPYLVLTIFRSAESATRALPGSVVAELTTEEQAGWQFVAAKGEVSQKEYAAHFGVTARTAQRHLGHFVELELVRRRGKGPATLYEIAPR